ncbi:MAG: ribonuclease R [Taibaiella sp.]|nr:ribonuclease R [Taibaiella sp.]
MPKKTKAKNKSNGSGAETLTGKLEVTRGGMGFVIVEGHEKDIIIKRDNIGNALNGDTVQVELRGYADGNKRQEGTIKSVIKRKQSEFSGRVEVHPHFAFLVPDSDKMPVDIYIPLHLLNGAQHGDKAIGKIVEWTGKTKNPVGEITSILTNESINEIAMQGILTENGFPLTFPDDVLEEAARYPDGVDSNEIKNRRDMRDTLTMTIDPADAKDFDDALSIKSMKGGWYEVGVHIADVGQYIVAGSALDKEAYKRATSVYLPDRVLPMLPERLSNELCSLRPNEEKYTFSSIFKINKKGEVKDTWIGKTIIHSNRRYSYEEVQEIIEGTKGDNQKEILLLNEMAQNMRADRFKKGAINFSSQEVRFKLDDKGKPIGIIIKESKEAHKLIEEFMLLANRTIAKYVSEINLNGQKVPFPYRVHDNPDPDKLKVFAVFALRFGIKLDLSKPEYVAQSFNEMLEKVNGKPEQHVLEQLGIRTMAKAIYTTSNNGHYGLGFEDYCHFTSPIRRYPDLLVHRILLECLQNNIHPIKNLEEQCRHCSDQERRAMDCERAANKYKQVEYMQDLVGEDFEAVISGVSNFGFWAETVDTKCEGMVSIGDLSDFDDFVFAEEEYALVGRSTGYRFGMGDKVTVRLVRTSLEKRQMDFAVLQLPEQKDKNGKVRAAGKQKAKSGGNPQARKNEREGSPKKRKPKENL